jgi:glycosyltransferase involved in cell wall biosynthesis
MRVSMFTSWHVRCGIADYAACLVEALRRVEGIEVSVVPFDRQRHPPTDYVRWGHVLNESDVAHIQHEYTFFGYLLPWRNRFHDLIRPVHCPLVITRHISFDGPYVPVEPEPMRSVRRIKWALYNRWLGPYATYLNRGTFDVADQIIVLNGHMKEQLVWRGVRPEKIHVIPPGVPDVPPATGGHRLRADWGWQDRRIVGQFGFIAAPKGHTLALEALARLPNDYVLLIAGGVRRAQDHAALEAIQRKIDQFNLHDRVRITGYVEQSDLPAHFDACDVLVYPNTRADFSYSVVVGLAYRSAPLIISDIPSHRELAEAGAGTLLFRNGDAEALADQIQAVMCHKELRAKALERAGAFLREHSWDTIAARTLEVYRLASSQPRGTM